MRMTTDLRIWVMGTLAAFVAVCGQAQDLKSLKGIYEKNCEAIRSGFQPKFDGLQQQYQKSLETLKDAAAKQGDFIRIKAAIAEIERFRKAKSLSASPDENEISEINSFQSAYIQQYAKLETDMTSQLGMLTSKYEQALDRLQKEQVKALKIEEAAAVQVEKEKAQAVIKSYVETLTSLKGPAVTNLTFVATSPKSAFAAGKPTGKQDLYMVVDLSHGSKVKEYPVSYLADVPKGGWDDECKTDKLVLRRIEPGTFTMGSPKDEFCHRDNETLHEVTLTQAFYIGVFEVTQKQWERVMGVWPSKFNDPRDRNERPVEQVTYTDIRGANDGANWPAANTVDTTSFMGLLRSKTGQAFDLPTEAQWEYACRAGTTTALYRGNNLTTVKICPNVSEVGRYLFNGGQGDTAERDALKGTAKSGSYRPNAWGLYDMIGNVSEWCLDWRGIYMGTESDPKGATTGPSRVRRGGNWGNYANYCRSANRDDHFPDTRGELCGFRVALPLSQR